MVATRRSSLVLFGALLLGICAIDVAAAHSQPFQLAPHDLGALAVTLDLALFMPFCYWWLVVRRARVSAVTIVLAFELGVAVASVLIPASRHEYLRVARWALVPAELVLLGVAGVRVRRAIRHYRTASAPAAAGDDVLDRLRDVLREMLGARVIADAIAYEAALVYYACFSWGARVSERHGCVAFSAHKRNGLGGLLVVALLISLVEMAVVHLLVMQWSNRTAWGLTALGLYGAVWMLGLYRSLRLRPILLSEQSLMIRVGLLSSITVSLGDIAAVRPARFPYPVRRTPGYLRAVPLGEPQFLIELKRPVPADGIYGIRKRVELVGLAVDEPTAFRATLDARLAAI